MIQEGKTAPKFTLLSDKGEKVSLGDFKGKTVVLYFYPKDMTSGCTQQACSFQKFQSKFKKLGAVVLGVSKDSVESHVKFRDKYSLSFPLLSDLDGKVCEAYGVWKEKSMYGRKYMGIERTTVIISPEGKIVKIYPKVKVGGHIETLVEALSEK